MRNLTLIHFESLFDDKLVMRFPCMQSRGIIRNNIGKSARAGFHTSRPRSAVVSQSAPATTKVITDSINELTSKHEINAHFCFFCFLLQSAGSKAYPIIEHEYD